MWDNQCAGQAATICIGFCGPSTGACCDPIAGVCEDGITQSGCDSVAGIWTNALSCVDFVCPPAPGTCRGINGSFELGNFAGWVTQDLTTPFFPLQVGGAGITPGFGFFTSAPTDGVFAALHGFDGDGPGTIVIAEDVTLPVGIGSLEFDYRAGWDLLTFGAALNRTLEVVIRPAGGGAPLLGPELILTAAAGTVQLDTGNLVGSVDVSAFAGQTVRLSFEWFVPELFTGPAFFQLDNIRCVPPPVCPGAGSCCVGHETPGCDDAVCCELVCGLDAFCCDVMWDATCAARANQECEPELCGAPGCPGEGDCCAVGGNGTPGCHDATCCDAVCDADPFCCLTAWDAVCAGRANDALCVDFCDPLAACDQGTGSCCVTNPTGGCSEASCCETVCQLLPSCCLDAWKPECVVLAEAHCVCEPPVLVECPSDATGDCCDPAGHGSPGCVDECCCRTVCSQDVFCCDVMWDAICAASASGASTGTALCPGVCTPEPASCPGVGSCFAEHPSPGCDAGTCCNKVCAVAPECCGVSWGPSCAAIATDVCVCSPPVCPDTAVTWLAPPDGFLDARQPHPLNDPTLPNGVAQIQVVAP
ncbi:MAG: hypothetical protein ACE5E5_13955, partial [Phycisphaerae bacterium]